jgi:copper chaperone CopZ
VPEYAWVMSGDLRTPVPSGTPVELSVEGMHCESCVALIEETLREDPRVSSVSVDLESGRASVVVDRAALTPDELCATIVELGYQATPVESGP